MNEGVVSRDTTVAGESGLEAVELSFAEQAQKIIPLRKLKKILDLIMVLYFSFADLR